MSATRNPNLGPSQLRLKKRRLFWIRSYIVAGVLFVLVIGLAIASGIEKTKIKNISVSGNVSVTKGEILDITERDLEGRYWYLFSRRNSLIFPRFKIESDLSLGIKRFEAVNVGWVDLNTIEIIVKERKPYSLWCGADERISDQCYFMDNTGYIFGVAPIFSGNAFLKYFGKIDEKKDPIGQYYLGAADYPAIDSFVAKFNELGYRLDSVSFDGRDFYLTLENGVQVILPGKNNLNALFDNLSLAISSKQIDFLGNTSLKYVDLRFDNKILVGKKEKAN
ncbi:MAG: hypothetical protein WCO10_01980 [bacterium]